MLGDVAPGSYLTTVPVEDVSWLVAITLPTASTATSHWLFKLVVRVVLAEVEPAAYSVIVPFELLETYTVPTASTATPVGPWTAFVIVRLGVLAPAAYRTTEPALKAKFEA